MLPMDISGINIITTSIYNDTLELEFAVDAIDSGDTIEYTYSTTTSPYITNLAGTQALNVSMEHITALFYPSTSTVGGDFVFEAYTGSQPGAALGVIVRVLLTAVLKNNDGSGVDKYMGWTLPAPGSNGAAGVHFICCAPPQGAQVLANIPNQGTPGARGLRLCLGGNVSTPLNLIKFKVEIDLPSAGMTDMGDCEIWMQGQDIAPPPPTHFNMQIRFFDLDNLGAGELNAQDINNWLPGGDYVGQTIRITYVSGGT